MKPPPASSSLALFFLCAASSSGDVVAAKEVECDVVVVGGSTSALAAAIVSAKEGARTCLLEPTDWAGGQLSASGVTAIDWAWHTVTDHNRTVNVAKAARDPRNQPAVLRDIVARVGSPGKCWVSYNCFLPDSFLAAAQAHTAPLEASGMLTVLAQTVAVGAVVSDDGTRVKAVKAVRRTFLGGGNASTSEAAEEQCGGYDVLFSQDIADWYSPHNSTRFAKEQLVVHGAVFIDASEFGDLLVLSDAPFLQGIAERFDGDASGEGGSDVCGQAATFGFSEELFAAPTPEPPNPFPDPRWATHFSFEGYLWDKIWTYRRLLAKESGGSVQAGDVTLQNWGGGNDNDVSYVLVSRDDARKSAKEGRWMGGVNTTALHDAETLAFGWHYFFKQRSGVKDFMQLSKRVWGTCHGLAKMPYMRDTRRSIGVDGFVMNVSMINGSAVQVVGEVFWDRVALGAYGCDIHGLRNGCVYPPYMTSGYTTLPYFVPLRALTNRKVGNLVLAGKTIAQSFLVNAATRLQPPEWSTGTAAGATAAFMLRTGIGSTATLVQNATAVALLQMCISAHAPIAWTVDEKLYPPQ